MPKVEIYQLLSKRFIGWANWNRSRRKIHDMGVLAGLTAHLRQTGPDHVVVTGDLVNIALPAEFAAAQAWLRTLGEPDHVSLVPGNHDAYVSVPRTRGIELWRDYMRGTEESATLEFPFYRRVGPLAIIGMSSSVPTMPFRATGRIQAGQYARAGAYLEQARKQGLARVIMIHHPPLPGLSPRHKRLKRAVHFETLVRTYGADLILHGHLHKSMVNFAEGRDGPVPVVGVGSASSSGMGNREPAGWHMYEIERRGRGVAIAMSRYGLVSHGQRHTMELVARRTLSTG